MAAQSPQNEKAKSRFEETVQREPATSLLRDTIGFLKNNKKWWLLPIVGTLLVIGALLMLSSTAVAPFIYTLF